MQATLPVDRMRLRFVLHSDAPPEFRRRWGAIQKTIADDGDEEKRRATMADWVGHCRLATNRKLPFLCRCECGIGGDGTSTDKQIRFRFCFGTWKEFKRESRGDPHGIVADCITDGTGDAAAWSYDELADLVRTFCARASVWMGSGAVCVDGFIDVRP
jgi:hypothetical protein